VTDRAAYVARRAIEQQLAEVVLDDFGAPDRKLPDCPLCGEDELYGWRNDVRRGFSCYRCSYKFTVHERPARQSSAPAAQRVVNIDLDDIEREVNEQLVRNLALSMLILRAGGTLVLTDDELRAEHGIAPQIRFDERSRTYTLTSVPCSRCQQRRAEVGQA
jgi:hypothetical protein